MARYRKLSNAAFLILVPFAIILMTNANFSDRQVHKRDGAVLTTPTLDESEKPGERKSQLAQTVFSNGHSCRGCEYKMVTESKFYCIEKYGAVRLIRPLDKEKSDTEHQYRIYVQGNNNHRVYNGSFAVKIDDINDNAPEFLLPKNLIVFNPPQLSASFVLADPDSARENGNNLSAVLDPKIADEFSLNCSSPAKGHTYATCTLTPKPSAMSFGRLVYVPVNVSDFGPTPMSAIRHLPVYFAGTTNTTITVHLFRYESESHLTLYYDRGAPTAGMAEHFEFHCELDGYSTETVDVGTVYADGLRNTIDKDQFNIRRAPSGVNISADSHLTVDFGSIAAGEHEIEIVASSPNSEQKFFFTKLLIRDISERQLRNAGSVRLEGVRASDFFRPLGKSKSRYDVTQEVLQAVFDVLPSEIAIFSVVPEGRRPEVLQVYFTVLTHNQRHTKTYLNGKVSAKKHKLQDALGSGAKIVQVGVNDCVFENCGEGCTDWLEANGTITDTVDAEGTRFIGIPVIAKTSNECQKPASSSCSPNPCFNRGLCHNTTSSIFCECRDPQIRGIGPFCQGRMRSFPGGDAFLWLDPIKPCGWLSVDFYFMTMEPTALLLYDGLMTRCDSNNYYCTRDYIALYYSESNVTLQINLGGAKEYVLRIAEKVNDGLWHKVVVSLEDKNLSLIVDSKGVDTFSIEDDFGQLNVNDPLHLGGLVKQAGIVYPGRLHNLPNFNGCIRDLHINGIMQDLANPPHQVDTVSGCSQTDTVCSHQGKPYCLNGLCVASIGSKNSTCSCDLGYGGQRCDKPVSWHEFRKGHVQYNVTRSAQQKAKLYADIQMLIMPENVNGVLFNAVGSGGRMQIKLENGNLVHSTHASIRSHALPVSLNLNEQYLVRLTRYPRSATLFLDAQHFAAQSFSEQPITPTQYFVGAEHENMGHFEGCIAQVSYDQPIALPHDNFQLPDGVHRSHSPTVKYGCPSLRTCDDVPCYEPYICTLHPWKGPICTCRPGTEVFDHNDIWIKCGPHVQPEPRLVLIILLILICCFRRQRRPDSSLPPSIHSDFRGDLGADDTHGAGEANQSKYDLNVLRVPILPPNESRTPSSRGTSDTPLLDETRPFAVEQPTASVGSLSTLQSEEDDDADVDWQKWPLV